MLLNETLIDHVVACSSVKLKAVLELVRVEHVPPVILALVAGYFLASRVVNYEVLVAGTLVATLAEFSLFALNDYYNIEEDRVNAPWRPLVRGDLAPKEALGIGVISLVSALAIATYLALRYSTYLQLAVLIVFLSLGHAYNVRVKKVGPVGNLIVATASSAPLLYGYTLVKVPDVGTLPLLILFYVTATLAMYGREVVKGVIDIEGDYRVGIRTWAIVYGREAAQKIAAMCFFTAIALSLVAVTYLTSIYAVLTYLPLILLTDAIYARSGLMLLRYRLKRRELEQIRKGTLLGAGIALIAYLLVGVLR